MSHLRYRSHPEGMRDVQRTRRAVRTTDRSTARRTQATPADDAAFAADLWGDGFADAFSDASTNWFSAEIENVSASDWDIDTAQIWDGDDGADDVTDGGDAVGGDFPM